MADMGFHFNVESVVEDVLQQQGKRLCDIDVASRKAEEASLRRYDASGWLRKMVGVVYGKDLPAQPSEEEFRLGLRSGIILCNVLNKVQPGAVPKVVEAPSDTVLVPDGAALSAYQYFENVRNFLDAIQEMGIPTFEASDLEQEKSSRIVSCVLAMKSYHEWKQGGSHGVWKYSGNSKSSSAGKFMSSISRNSPSGDKSLDSSSSDRDLVHDFNEMGPSHSLHILVRELLSDKSREDIPSVVENMLTRVKEEFERRVASHSEHMTTTSTDIDVPDSDQPQTEHVSETSLELPEDASEPIGEHVSDDQKISDEVKDEYQSEQNICVGQPKDKDLKQQILIEKQQRDIQELKSTLNSAKNHMQILQMSYQEEVNNLGKHLYGLANAASKYQKVLEENCKLYNQVQDLKGNIRVYCRVRPFMPGKPNHMSAVEDLDERTITILTPTKYGKEGRKSFNFNRVFGPSATQEEVFADTQPLIRSVLDGFNVCIFAYGQTGSGKTHTMTGPPELTKESVGVNFRALSDLFHISEQRKDSIAYDVNVQMIEIYNEQVRDLLMVDGGFNKRLEIRNNTANGINVPDANIVHVTSTSDVINLMNLGQKNRAVGSTAMNVRSSRSHSCLTVHVQGTYLTSGKVIRGCMHLVDLAGSERADKSEAVGDRLKEAQHINKSLSALGDVIASLAQKQSHVPYRNSKLTQLLQDSLGGQAKTLMFVHISPEPDAVGETLSTLKFAERVSTVELGTARANKDSTGVKELKQQISNLKAALARKEGESGSRGSSPARSWHGDASKSEGQSTSSLSRRQSFELQDMLINSPNWPPSGSPGLMDDEKEGIPDDWVDNHPGKFEEQRELQEMFFQKCVPPDASKLFIEQPLNKVALNRRHSLENDIFRGRYETNAADESDELDAATSDSSEPDYQHQRQQSVPRTSSIPNLRGSKLRKPSPKQSKIPEIRSLIPPPTKRVSNGITSPLHKPGQRQPSSLERKQKPGYGK